MPQPSTAALKPDSFILIRVPSFCDPNAISKGCLKKLQKMQEKQVKNDTQTFNSGEMTKGKYAGLGGAGVGVARNG